MEPCKILMLVKDARYGKCDNNSGHMWETWNTHYEDWSSENRNYKKFLAELKSLMKICDDDDVKIVYLDDDNDEIPIECDEELREALNVAYFMNREYKRSMPIVIKNSEEDATKLELIEAVVENSQKQEKKKRVCSDSSFLQEEPDAKVFFGKNVNYPNRRERSVRFRESPTTESTAHPSDSNFIMDNVKERMDVVNKIIEELKMELLRMKVNKISLNECSEPPAWFKLALDQFKNEILLEVEMMLDERLGVMGENCELKTGDVGNTESKTDVASQSTNKPSTSTYSYNPRCKKLLRKLEELYEKERRLDMRMEKMESKKIKMWEKMALKNEAKMENTNRLSRFNASVEKRNPIHVVPSKDFVINWKIKNTGVFAWDELTEMRVFELSHGLKACHKKIKCPKLQPSSEGDISVRFVAPAKEGIYSAKWLLFHAKKQFGPWICIKVIVENQPSEEIPAKASENDSEMVENNKVTTNGNSVPEAHILPTENTALMRDFLIPKDDDLSDTEIVLENLENWNLEDSDDDPFVIVPMPTCFFPDKPVDSNDVVHMKLKRKSAREQKSRKTNENNDIQADKTDKEASMDGAVGGTIPDEPYESVEGSVYMVDRAGKCFLINDSNEEADGKMNDSEDNKKLPVLDDRPFVVRDKINKCVYLNRKEQPIPLPAFKSEKIFIDDPEFSNTKYFMCDGVIVEKGVLVPLFDPHYEFNMGFYQPGPISPTAQPEFVGPFPFSTVPPPPPPITFPPPQIYQSFIPPPPPPHVPRPPPAPLAPPFHPFIVPPHHMHLQQHMPEHFSNVANQQWDYLQHINRNPNFTTNPTNDLSQNNNSGLLQQNNEIKKDDSCKNSDNSCIPSSTTESKSMKKSKSTKEPGLENIASRKHKLNMFRMKKMKILSEGESSGNDKKKSDGNIKKLKLHPMYDCNDFALPATDDVINPTTETITTNTDTASNDNNDENNTSLVVSATEETPTDENNQTNSPPVNILPEGLVNGTVNAAICAYSTAVSALSSLMTYSRVDDSAPVTDDDKLQRGLATLHEMGFQNTAKNARLLKKYNYSVAEAVENYCMNLGE